MQTAPPTPGELSAPAAPKLRLVNVTKTFSNSTQTVQALHPTSLDIQEGEYVVLFGPSGCGKSTLLNLIAGFDDPSSGEIILDGQRVDGPANERLLLLLGVELVDDIDATVEETARAWLATAKPGNAESAAAIRTVRDALARLDERRAA